MLVCKDQKNTFNIEGKVFCISDKIANAYFYMCDMPLTEEAVKMYIEFFLRDEIAFCSNQDMRNAVEKGVKREFLDLFTEDEWSVIEE